MINDHLIAILTAQFFNALAVGGIYALIALGYTMVYGVLRFINFAHSDIFMVGAFSGYYLARFVPQASVTGGVFVLLGAMAICALLGVVIEKLAYRPLRGRSTLTALITAIGVSLLLQNLGQRVKDADPATLAGMHRIKALGRDVYAAGMIEGGAEVELLTGADVSARWPQLAPPGDVPALAHARAGFVASERATAEPPLKNWMIKCESDGPMPPLAPSNGGASQAKLPATGLRPKPL
mgnify:CR=1 FL=1